MLRRSFLKTIAWLPFVKLLETEPKHATARDKLSGWAPNQEMFDMPCVTLLEGTYEGNKYKYLYRIGERKAYVILAKHGPDSPGIKYLVLSEFGIKDEHSES